ncbi:UNVERIFIED_CONTAM: hypothetical protein Scaly_2593000 [Sesamum calycinum]|uniref:Uncharacterized protein n=1 Tax=Sesamum calycinum TaxID=2727403 RepID=A0AAW2JDA1_9LAMI
MFSLRRLSSNASTSSAVDNFSTRRFLSNGFRLKGSCSENYGSILRNNNDFKNDRCNSNVLQKAKEYGPWLPQLLRVSEEVIGVKDQLKRSVNAEGDANRGSSNGVLNQFLSQKIMVAVDVDEADIRVHEFFKTSYFKKGFIQFQVPERLFRTCPKSRQNAIKDHTVGWIEKHYPGLFQEIHFGNHFALDGQSRPKSDICRSLGAKVLIDDNPRYAIECAEVGIKVLLFDYENSYPWSKTDDICEHPRHQGSQLGRGGTSTSLLLSLDQALFRIEKINKNDRGLPP